MMMMAVVQQYFAPSRLASFYTVKLKKIAILGQSLLIFHFSVQSTIQNDN